MKNIHTTQQNISLTTKTHKKPTHINVRHIPDSGFHIPVISRLSVERLNGSGGSTLKPHTIPPDHA